MVTALFLSILLALRSCIPTAEQSKGRHPIELKVSPQVCFALCTVHATVYIDPHADNRWWVVQIDGPQFQSTARELEGDAGKPTQPIVTFKGLSEGSYEITAVLYRTTGEVARTRDRVLVADGHVQ